MTNYQIVWTPSAEQDLAAVWLDAVDRTAVALAANEIEQRLADNPLFWGQSRTSSVNRALVVPPLGVLYEVIVDDLRVFVQAVMLVD